MVLLEHVGYGGRDRQLHMYYWDLRDGPDFNGWWITADYIGNNEFILSCGDKDAETPADCEVCGPLCLAHASFLHCRSRSVLLPY